MIYISQQYPDLVFPADWELIRIPYAGIPRIEAAREADFILTVGVFDNVEWAGQLSGLLERVIPEGRVLIVAFPGDLGPALGDVLFQRLRIEHGFVDAAQPVDAWHPAFTDYFALFGKTRVTLAGDEPRETLGRFDDEDFGGYMPAAVALTRGLGAIYLLPFVFAGAEGQFPEQLANAITAHLADAGAVIPAFLADLRLPGEDEVLAQIAEAKAQLNEQAAYLEHFRLLLGPRGTGQALEDLVIEALNVVFEGTDYRAEDRADERAEDFWIVGPDGDLAIAEVKGVNTNIRREDVNQVDNHREAGGLTQEVPGLLVVNTFRGSETLQEREQPVPEQAMSRATNSNVLILRTRDLYNLVLRKRDGADASQELLDALGAGGWLDVTPNAAALKPDR